MGVAFSKRLGALGARRIVPAAAQHLAAAAFFAPLRFTIFDASNPMSRGAPATASHP